MPQQNYIAFIDESGTLPDPGDLVVVIAAVVAEAQNQNLARLLARIRRHLPRKGKRKSERHLTELNFYKTSEKTRLQILRALAEQEIALFVLVVDKQGKSIKDTAENYAKLMSIVLQDCLTHVPTLRQVYLDQHFTRPLDRTLVFQSLEIKQSSILEVDFVDSTQETRIDLADFVAAAVLYRYEHNDAHYEDLIRGKIAGYRLVRWSEKEKW